VATLFILLQAAVLYSSMRPEVVPPALPLSEFPTSLGSWQMTQSGVVDQETRDILQADDLLDRVYRSGHGAASLFVAAFRSTRNGKTPHSPKNCLPGSGWSQISSDDAFPVNLGGGPPVLINRYIVEHGGNRSVVLYWYQSRDRVVSNEFKAKFWVMADAIKLNRTDTALVRVVVNINPATQDEDLATNTAVDFVRSFFGPLHQYLPL
jgi:EpsI family protein